MNIFVWWARVAILHLEGKLVAHFVQYGLDTLYPYHQLWAIAVYNSVMKGG